MVVLRSGNSAAIILANFRKRVQYGWNAEPELDHRQEVKQQWSKEEVARKFNSSDLDDDLPSSTTRGDRHSSHSPHSTHSTPSTHTMQGEIHIP
ncbi:hypothetical protein Aduo_001912 [Ancylostoma duodenale]